MIAVLTEWYIDSSPERQAELVEALCLNCAHPLVSAVWLLGTVAALAVAPKHPKIVLYDCGGRATFGGAFAVAAEWLEGQLCAIVNADCYFDETLTLAEDIDMRGRALCLTRWDVTPEAGLRFYDRAVSQDAWIFRGGVRVTAPFHFGIPGCDNRIAWILKHEAGLKLANPSQSLRVCHLHLTGKRNYDPRRGVPGPRLGVVPTLLNSSQPEEALFAWR